MQVEPPLTITVGNHAQRSIQVLIHVGHAIHLGLKNNAAWAQQNKKTMQVTVPLQMRTDVAQMMTRFKNEDVIGLQPKHATNLVNAVALTTRPILLGWIRCKKEGRFRCK